jgi:hypothetical protein
MSRNLKEEFRRLNPDHVGEPLLWAMEVNVWDRQCVDAALMKLALDCEINPPNISKITDQAVYAWADDLNDNGTRTLVAYIQRRFLDNPRESMPVDPHDHTEHMLTGALIGDHRSGNAIATSNETLKDIKMALIGAGDYPGVIRNTLADLHKIDELKGRIKHLESVVVSVFTGDEVPSFRQGLPIHELEEAVTAEECEGYVAKIKSAREAMESIIQIITMGSCSRCRQVNEIAQNFLKG